MHSRLCGLGGNRQRRSVDVAWRPDQVSPSLRAAATDAAPGGSEPFSGTGSISLRAGLRQQCTVWTRKGHAKSALFRQPAGESCASGVPVGAHATHKFLLAAGTLEPI